MVVQPWGVAMRCGLEVYHGGGHKGVGWAQGGGAMRVGTRGWGYEGGHKGWGYEGGHKGVGAMRVGTRGGGYEGGHKRWGL